MNGLDSDNNLPLYIVVTATAWYGVLTRKCANEGKALNIVVLFVAVDYSE